MIKSVVYSFLIGTYGSMVYQVEFDAGKGLMKVLGKYEAANASYAIGKGSSIYTFSESGENSKVYSIKDGVRTEVPCCGDNPCFINFSPDSNYLFTADYSGGSVSVYPLIDGAVGERIQKLSFEGSGPVTRRQASPHIHQVKILPQMEGVAGEWILAPDLGSDKIRILKYTGHNGTGADNGTAANIALLEHFGDVQFPAGSGPRHIEFDMVRRMMYCIAELSGKVFAFKMGERNGAPSFELVQSVVADEYNTGGSGDIHIHPSGKWLYTSHRLQNDGLAVFEVDEGGLVKKIGYVPTFEHPRNFLITPCGKYILVASKNKCSIQLFKIGENGIPQPTATVFDFSPDSPTSIILQ